VNALREKDCWRKCEKRRYKKRKEKEKGQVNERFQLG